MLPRTGGRQGRDGVDEAGGWKPLKVAAKTAHVAGTYCLLHARSLEGREVWTDFTRRRRGTLAS